jgi:hypothetical protein
MFQVKAAELKQQYKTWILDSVLSHVDAIYAIVTTCSSLSNLILSSHIPDLQLANIHEIFHQKF